MMNRLMNRASPASTWLGGTLDRPSALRVMLSTTKTFVNEVIVSSSAGATDNSVRAIRMVIDWLGFTPLTSMLTVPSGEPSTTGALGGLGGLGVGTASAVPGASSGPSRSARAHTSAGTRSTNAAVLPFIEGP